MELHSGNATVDAKRRTVDQRGESRIGGGRHMCEGTSDQRIDSYVRTFNEHRSAGGEFGRGQLSNRCMLGKILAGPCPKMIRVSIQLRRSVQANGRYRNA